MNSSIAILVPTYNATSTLGPTLTAMRALEGEMIGRVALVMISDDGSTDGTVELARELWSGSSLPMLMRCVSPNGGEYRNVNGAVADMPAAIEWVLIMHADNIPLPGWVQKLCDAIALAPPEVATICGSYEYVCDGVVRDRGDREPDGSVVKVAGDAASIRGTLVKGCWWHNSAAAIRVSAWRAIGGHPAQTPLLGMPELLGWRAAVPGLGRQLRIKGDWDSFLRMLSSGYSAWYLPTPLMQYIEVSSSVSAGSFAWHGDLLESQQVLMRHQSALGLADLIWLHAAYVGVLLRRLVAAIARRHWRRAGWAIQAFPVMIVAALISIWRRIRRVGGVTQTVQPMIVSTATQTGRA